MLKSTETPFERVSQPYLYQICAEKMMIFDPPPGQNLGVFVPPRNFPRGTVPPGQNSGCKSPLKVDPSDQGGHEALLMC